MVESGRAASLGAIYSMFLLDYPSLRTPPQAPLVPCSRSALRRYFILSYARHSAAVYPMLYCSTSNNTTTFLFFYTCFSVLPYFQTFVIIANV